jgi:hypothetical protein
MPTAPDAVYYAVCFEFLQSIASILCTSARTSVAVPMGSYNIILFKQHNTRSTFIICY